MSNTENFKEQLPNDDIKTVLDAHAETLMAVAGVTGVAIGATEDGVECIMILINEKTEETKKKLPREISGHPVRLHVTGDIKPMDSN